MLHQPFFGKGGHANGFLEDHAMRKTQLLDLDQQKIRYPARRRGFSGFSAILLPEF